MYHFSIKDERKGYLFYEGVAPWAQASQYKTLLSAPWFSSSVNHFFFSPTNQKQQQEGVGRVVQELEDRDVY